MKTWLAGLIVFIVSVSAAVAGPPVVLPDRVTTGAANGEYFPRPSTLPNPLVVPAGETLNISGELDFDGYEFAGTVRCTGPVTLRGIDLPLILPGGTFDCQQPFVFIRRNVPIDTSRDPFKRGGGLINMGRLILLGPRVVTPEALLTVDLPVGAMVIEGEFPPEWQAGDELAFPDIRQIRPAFHSNPRMPRQEPRRFIAHREGNTITLDQPLLYEHGSVRRPDGSVVRRAPVLNITRDATIMSENPADINARAHVMMLGPDASWKVRNVFFADLGRTTADPRDSATVVNGVVTVSPTNPAGNYFFHMHETQGFGNEFGGNVLYDRLAKTTWGIAIHSTSDTLVEDNVTIGMVGAGIVTEAGDELRNVIRGNIGMFHFGNDRSTSDNLNRNSPGADGNFLWLRGVEQVLNGNKAYNCRIGINFFPSSIASMVPSVPGGPHDTPYKGNLKGPISATDNIAIANTKNGLESWFSPVVLTGERYLLAYNGQNQITTEGGGGSLWFKDLRIFADASVVGTTGVDVTGGYNPDLRIEGGEIRGTNRGIGETFISQLLTDLTLQNVVNISHAMSPRFPTVMERVVHEPLGSFPKRYVELPTSDDYVPWSPATGAKYRVINWQGTGQDYLIYYAGSRRSLPTKPATQNYPGRCPVSGITMGECWDRYGLSAGGASVADADIVPLEGLSGAVAKEGLSEAPLPVPRAVITFPNGGAPATVQADGRIALLIFTTGDAALANGNVLYQIDGGVIQRHVATEYTNPYYRTLYSTAIAEGAHTVRTWRESPSGVAIAASQVDHVYLVGASTPPPPPPPPPEVCGDGIDNDGDGQIDEGCAPPPPPPPPPCQAGAFGDVVVSGKTYRVTVDGQCVPTVAGPLN